MQIDTFVYSKKDGWSDTTFAGIDSDQTLVLVFASADFEDPKAPLSELASHYPKSKIMGCSARGEVLGDYLSDDTMVVAVVHFENTQLCLAKAELKGMENSLEAGKSIVKQLKKDDLKGIFVLSEGIAVNGSDLALGLNSINRDDVIITGALAACGTNPDTWTICDGEILYDYVVAIGFYGPYVQIGSSFKGGWDVFGPERVITRSEGKVLYELDDKPALDLYKEYLGKRAEFLSSEVMLYPLAIRQDIESEYYSIRSAYKVDEEERSVTFGGDIPMGAFAKLMRFNLDRIIDSAGDAAAEALEQINAVNSNSEPILAITISAVGRRRVLGEKAEEEVQSSLDQLPKQAKQVGFYSFGVLAPFEVGNCQYHNQTMTLTVFSEKGGSNA